MTKTFTENELVRVLYDEATEAEQQQVKHALMTNESNQELFFSLQQVKSELDQLEIMASESLTKRILEEVSNLKEVSL